MTANQFQFRGGVQAINVQGSDYNNVVPFRRSANKAAPFPQPGTEAEKQVRSFSLELLPLLLQLKKSLSHVMAWREHNNNMARLFEWNAFVDLIALDLPQQQAMSVQRLWKTLTSTFSTQLPLPRIRKLESGEVRFSWSRVDRYLDISIDEKGLGDWFCSVAGQPPVGTPEDPEVVPTTQIVELIRRHFQTSTVP